MLSKKILILNVKGKAFLMRVLRVFYSNMDAILILNVKGKAFLMSVLRVFYSNMDAFLETLS
jgi:hypothetical protein